MKLNYCTEKEQQFKYKLNCTFEMLELQQFHCSSEEKISQDIDACHVHVWSTDRGCVFVCVYTHSYLSLPSTMQYHRGAQNAVVIFV